MANSALWSHDKFSEYFKSSPRRAFEFRRETLGDEIPEEYLTQEEKEALAGGVNLEINSVETPVAETVIENPVDPVAVETPISTDPVVEVPIVTETPVETPKEEEMVEIEMTRDQLKAKLDEAGVKYFKGADSQKLADLCVANNLL